MVLRSLVVCLVACALTTPSLARAQDPIYDAVGSQYGRGFFAPLPFERIDVVTGNVFLSFYGAGVPEVGVTFSYDALGRHVNTLRPDGSYVSTFFGPATVGVQEAGPEHTLQFPTQGQSVTSPVSVSGWAIDARVPAPVRVR